LTRPLGSEFSVPAKIAIIFIFAKIVVPIEFVVNMMKKSVEIVSVQTHGLKPIVGIEKN